MPETQKNANVAGGQTPGNGPREGLGASRATPTQNVPSTSRGETSIEHWCSCGAHWMIEADGNEPVVMLSELIRRHHGLDIEKHRAVSPEECRKARLRKARWPSNPNEATTVTLP